MLNFSVIKIPKSNEQLTDHDYSRYINSTKSILLWCYNITQIVKIVRDVRLFDLCLLNENLSNIK